MGGLDKVVECNVHPRQFSFSSNGNNYGINIVDVNCENISSMNLKFYKSNEAGFFSN